MLQPLRYAQDKETICNLCNLCNEQPGPTEMILIGRYSTRTQSKHIAPSRPLMSIYSQSIQLNPYSPILSLCNLNEVKIFKLNERYC